VIKRRVCIGWFCVGLSRLIAPFAFVIVLFITIGVFSCGQSPDADAALDVRCSDTLCVVRWSDDRILICSDDGCVCWDSMSQTECKGFGTTVETVIRAWENGCCNN